VCKGIVFIYYFTNNCYYFFQYQQNGIPAPVTNHNQPLLRPLTKYLTEKCKLLTGHFPTFPCEKSFCILTMKEIPVLLHFKKLVQRK